MAGHSHWAGIKHKKALVDSKRSKLWSKLSKAIIVAAKLGGGDPDGNIRLRAAILEAKSLSLPKDNIERAIKKGTGEIDGGNVEETLYEGYGPGGVAIMCDIMTDNRNRTAPEIRKIFDVHGGALGGTGCVAYIFERKGVIAIDLTDKSEEQIIEIALENNALDVETRQQRIELTTSPECLSQLANAFEQAGIEMEVNEVVRVPQTTVDVDEETATTILKLLETLEDHDDVQAVSTNLNFEHPTIARLISSGG
ncbi:MAG: YebC/PmpR family DNA-binding transcriptional regulator [Pirellulaceae bacterium]|jgi:YebC/PmpR family DNA-binding regulatory protein|nr:YebC/PmpR family DNA-binding transcriptional regulator [Pirellulaceae bacterium]